MNTILYAEINILCIAVLVLIAIGLQNGENSRKKKFFEASIWCSMLSGLCDLVWNLGRTEYLTISQTNGYVVNFAYFAGLVGAAYFIFLYFEDPFKSWILKSKLGMVLAGLPGMVMIALLIRSLSDGCIFSVDADGAYHRGELHFLQVVLTDGYVAAAAIRKLADAILKRGFENRDDWGAVVFLAVPMILCGVIQGKSTEVPVVACGIVLVDLMIYIYSLQRLVSKDTLTGINNRRELLRLLEGQIAVLRKGERLYFLFLDIDSFKQINDIYGHNEGDQILKLVATSIEDVCLSKNGFCARYGGDEFAVVKVLRSGEKLSAFKRVLRQTVEERSLAENLAYPVSVSIGSAKYRGGGIREIPELISHADRDMYDKKHAQKN